MPYTEMHLKVVGPRANESFWIRGHYVEKGRITLRGDATAVSTLADYMRRTQQLYPAGSKEYDAAHERYVEGLWLIYENKEGEKRRRWEKARTQLIALGELEARDGSGGSTKTAKRQPAASVRRSVSTDRSDKIGATTAPGPGRDDAEANAAGKVSSGDRPSEGVSRDEKEGVSYDDIAAAVRSLDVDDDSCWTKDGKPAIQAVQDLVGHALTRPMIEASSPNYRRGDE